MKETIFPVGEVSIEPTRIDVKKLFNDCFDSGEYHSSGDREYILDDSGQTILLFNLDDDGTVKSVYSPRLPKELARELLALSGEHEEVRNLISEAFKLPEPSSQDIAAFENISQERQRDRVALKEFTQNSIAYGLPKIDQSKTRGAFQGDWIVSDADSDINCVGSGGAGSCVIVFIRRKASKDAEGNIQPARAAVAHVDALTKIDSLNDAMKTMPSDEPLDIYLVGGNESASKETLLKLKSYFDQHDVNVYADVMHGTMGATMDISTGKIAKGVDPHNYGERAAVKGQLVGLKTSARPLSLDFDGTLSEEQRAEKGGNFIKEIIDAGKGADSRGEISQGCKA